MTTRKMWASDVWILNYLRTIHFQGPENPRHAYSAPPDVIASAVSYLCKPESYFITGMILFYFDAKLAWTKNWVAQTISIDSGWMPSWIVRLCQFDAEQTCKWHYIVSNLQGARRLYINAGRNGSCKYLFVYIWEVCGRKWLLLTESWELHWIRSHDPT